MNTDETGDIVEQPSGLAFRPTLDRLVAAIEAAGLTIFARIDHAAGARDAGLEMPPSTLLIYGSPKGGTPVMLSAPAVALDLPLRVLVRETGDGRALVSFHPAGALLRRAGVPDPLASRLEPAQRLLLDAISETS